MLKLIKKYPKQADIALLVVGFSLGANFFMFLKLHGMDELGFSIEEKSIGFHWINPTIAGLIIGLGLSFFEFRLFVKFRARNRYLQAFIRLTVFTFWITVSISSVQVVSSYLFHGTNMKEGFAEASYFFKSGVYFSLYVYLMLLGVSLNFIRSIGNRFGHGILFNYLAGKYREPVEEHRIFMFIDLNGSTGHAERLGHIKYSRLLNRCFHDLTSVLTKYGGEVYQYVGDEAVITWEVSKGARLESPILMFHDFEKLLQKGENNYLEKFGVKPTFKAAINSGIVTVTEVGGRKDLAYHGDVLNTCSRLLELCKRYEKNVLCTQFFLEGNFPKEQVETQFLTTIQLRGKKEKVGIYSIRLSNP